jgi:undecaprenyl diphosphate synthase
MMLYGMNASFPMPRHVGVIMDGNGRWAEERGLDRSRGHESAESAIASVVDAAAELDIENLTLYAFSTENWKRPTVEVAFLMAFAESLIAKLGPPYHERGIRMRFLGSPSSRIPASLRTAINDIHALTANNDGLTLTFAFNHGGRDELATAFKSMLRSGVAEEDLDEELISAHLQYPDMPDLDLVIRTGGEYRLSNFLIWLASYAELIFLETLWPDFRAPDFYAAIDVYRTRRRRFGSLNLPEPRFATKKPER